MTLESIEFEEARREAEADVRAVAPGILNEEGGGFRIGGPFAERSFNGFIPVPERPLSDGDSQIHVVPWEWHGIDDLGDRGGLAGLGATGRTVILRGVTMVTRDDERGLQLFRYIDWMDAFTQAGISVATRPILQSGPLED
jgi:hypothetical protein